MSTRRPHRRSSAGRLSGLLVLTCLALAAPATATAQSELAARLSSLNVCLRTHPAHCATARRAVRLARTRLAAARARAAAHKRRSGTHPQPPPAIPVSAPTPTESPSGGSGPPSGGGSAGAGSGLEGTSAGGSGSAGGEAGGGSETSGQPFVKGVDTNLAGWGTSSVPEIASEMRSLGVNWEREDLAWSEAEPAPGLYDWSPFERIVAAAKANGITILPIVGYAPSWTGPGNATAYAEFVAAAVARFGPGTAANLQWWELWNEPYFAYAWSGHTPEPEAYARDAVAAAKAARAIAPSVKLLIAADYQDSPQAGGSSPWETTWVTDMVSAEPTLAKWVDGVSVHPYGDDPANPVAKAGGWTDASGGWSFQRIDTIRAKFLAAGVNLPFWITEVGWSTWNVSEAAEAKNYSDLVVQVRARPWVRALFPYCLREFSAHPTDNQPGFGLLKFGAWRPKAGFLALAEGLKSLA